MSEKNFLKFLLPTIAAGVFSMMMFPVQAKKWIVTVKNYSFTPYNLTHVRAHDTIQWVWESGSHTTTSASIPACAESWEYAINQDTTSFIYIPVVNGTFFYLSAPDTAKNMNGQFTVTGASGVDEHNGKPTLSVFPNPFHNEVTVQIPLNFRHIVSVQIFNTEGKLVRTVFPGFSAGSKLLTIDTKDLPNGVFFFRLEDESHASSVCKAIHE